MPLVPAEESIETIHQKEKPIVMAAIILSSLLERFKAMAKGIPKRHIIIVANGAASLECRYVLSLKVERPLAFKKFILLIRSGIVR